MGETDWKKSEIWLKILNSESPSNKDKTKSSQFISILKKDKYVGFLNHHLFKSYFLNKSMFYILSTVSKVFSVCGSKHLDFYCDNFLCNIFVHTIYKTNQTKNFH